MYADLHQPTAAGTPIKWGSVGENTWDALVSQGQKLDEVRGIVRRVNPRVSYARPPDSTVRCWEELPNDKRYEMCLDTNDLPPYESLYDLSIRLTNRERELHANGQVFSPDDPDLEKLDWLADQLLRKTERFHQDPNRPYSVGLLHPKNTLVVQGSEGRELVLADVGFAWRPGGAMLPDWLVRNQEFKDLWDHAAETMNSQPFEAQSDLRTIARVLAWSLRARPAMLGLPRYAKAPNAIPTFDEDHTTRANVWAVLSSVLDGEITSARMFREALKKARLSAHFVKERKNDRPKKWPIARKIVRFLGPILLTVSVLVGAGVAVWKYWPPPPPPLPLCGDCPAVNEELRSLLAVYESTLAEWDQVSAQRTDKMEGHARQRQLKSEMDSLDEQLKKLNALASIKLTDNQHVQAKERECIRKLLADYDERLASLVLGLKMDLRGLEVPHARPILKRIDEQLSQPFFSLAQYEESPSWYENLKLLRSPRYFGF